MRKISVYTYFVFFFLFQSKIYEIFNIPSYILLPEDELQIHQYSDDDIKKVDEDIEKLVSRYRRVK